MFERNEFDDLTGTKSAIIEMILFVAVKLFMQGTPYLLFSISMFMIANRSIFNINGLAGLCHGEAHIYTVEERSGKFLTIRI